MTDPLFIIIVLSVCFTAFIIGRFSATNSQKNRYAADRSSSENKLLISESGKNKLQREIERLRTLNEQYLHFVVLIPETVKQLNSHLTFDEVVSSIIRFTKKILDADCIELYLYDEASQQLQLEAGLGSARDSKMTFSIGEGIIGRAAELQLIVTVEDILFVSGKEDKLLLAAPITANNRLIGALGIGNLKADLSVDVKRLLAMVTDLAGVALLNCKSLSDAQKQANTDSLTGLYNRKYFMERSLDEALRAVNYNLPLSIILFDIDYFKKYNDMNGHAEGDHLLAELGRMLRENTRMINVVARYGGEEFIIMLPDNDKNSAYLYGEKIRSLIESTPFRNREKQPLGFISISGGVATFPGDAETIEGTIKMADVALYKAKEAGRNRILKYEQPGLG